MAASRVKSRLEKQRSKRRKLKIRPRTNLNGGNLVTCRFFFLRQRLLEHSWPMIPRISVQACRSMFAFFFVTAGMLPPGHVMSPELLPQNLKWNPQ